MRNDSIGMFWEDEVRDRSRGEIIRPQPPIPETGWVKPNHLPDISSAPVISIDTETYDPELETHGPGWARGVGHIVGISVAVPGACWYFPIRHTIQPEDNMDPDIVIAWAKKMLSNPKQPKVGANLIYDIGWLKQEGVEVKGALFDVQHAEALLNETGRVSLDILGVKYLNEPKVSEQLYIWCSTFYGGNPGQKQRKNIWRSPPKLVGPYAEADADLPLRIIEKQWPLMQQLGLLNLFEMENKLTYLLMEMRFAGVTVDVAKAEEVREKLLVKQMEYQIKLDKIAGFQVNPNSSEHLQRLFDEENVAYPRTAKGNPSFTAPWFEKLNHPLGVIIREIKKLEKTIGTFIDGYIINKQVDNRIYCQFHQLRGDSGGTRSGRFSSSDPNLQNIPSRDPEIGPLIRSLFIPDEGHIAWRKYDYSQIEYRFLVHFAVGEGSDLVRKKFNDDPHIDYHKLTQTLVKEKTGIHLERKPIKSINFGLIYGMGVATLAQELGLTKPAAQELVNSYHDGAPYAKATMDACVEEARDTGVMTTILGRRSLFDLWEPERFTRNAVPLPIEKAVLQYGAIKRSKTHKALNRKLQGSAADMMKIAMVDAWEAGVFDETGIPKLTVHDELDFSDPGGKDEAFLELKHIMETAMPLSIPVLADGEIGPNWGYLKDIT